MDDYPSEKKSKKKRHFKEEIDANINEQPKKKKKTKLLYKEKTEVDEEHENQQSENYVEQLISKIDQPDKGNLEMKDNHKIEKKSHKKRYYDEEDINEVINIKPKKKNKSKLLGKEEVVVSEEHEDPHPENDVDEEDINEVINIKPKKKNKSKLLGKEEVVVSEEHEDPHPENDVECLSSKVPVKDDVACDTWTKEDYTELIKRMESQLPKNDTKSFTFRVEKLDWEKIKFRSFSIDECYEKWKVIRSKIRHFRLLSEVLQDAKAWVEKPWAVPFNKKKVRHPEQPPRPLSSFMLFYMDKKNKIIKRHPELKLTEISRLIGEKYKYLSEEKKEYYLHKARAMQEEYKENLSKFYQKYPELMQDSKKQPTNSSKPLPPIKLYIKDRLQKHQNDENFNQHSYMEKYKEMWKTLSDKKKGFWIRLARDEEEKFLEHLHENDLHEDENKPNKSYKSVISKEENAILDRLAGKPEKPPNSAYSLFSRLLLQDKDKNHVGFEPKNRMREIAKMWKELPEDQKKAYAEKVQHMQEIHKLEFANYLESLPEEKKAEELAKLQPKKKIAKKKVAKQDSAADSGKQELFKNEPEKPPVTAWDLFKHEFFKKNSHMPSKMAYKEAAGIWKTLSKKEIEKYKKKHRLLQSKYITDFEAFLKTLNEEELKEFAALKNARCGDEQNEDSVGEESSSEVEENSSGSPSDSSQESDSGVSEDS